jgi:hypothetical protein
MNDTVLLKLKVIVERAVRPVRASLARKKKMREELLAHVTGVFEDELARRGDETAALIETEKRFGEPGELAKTLQASVPKRDRFVLRSEQMIAPRSGESLFGRAVRHGVTAFALEIAAFIAMSPLFPFFWQPQELGTFCLLAMPILMGCGVTAFVSTLLIHGLERALFGEAGRSSSRASLLLIVAFVIPVLLYFGLISAMSVLVSDDIMAFGMARLGAILSAAILFPSILVLLACQLSSDNRYRAEWSQLQID